MPLIIIFVYQSAIKELNEYLSVLSDFRNPIVFSLIFLIIIFVVFFLAMRNSVLPRQKKMQQEKSALEASNLCLMAIFAEADPDPVIRINISGEIIFTNPAARKSGFNALTGKPITDIITILNIHPEEFIKNDKELNCNLYFSEKYYSVFVKGMSYLNVAQIYMHDITELKEKEEELNNSHTELKEFSKHLQQKVEEERKRIARELHDDIGQKMILLGLSLQKDFINMTNNENPPELARNSRLLEGITSDIKAIAHSLVPDTIEETGLYSSLISLIEVVELQCPIKGSLDIDDPEERLDINLEMSIFRIVQEAVNNIIKYSKAKEYNIELKRKAAGLRLIISDDGVGFELKKNSNSRGMGLKNMKERAELHGGKLRIITSPMEGTVIIVNFPSGE